MEQLAEMSRLGVQPDSMLGTALVDACARSGQMQMAQAAFEELFGAAGGLTLSQPGISAVVPSEAPTGRTCTTQGCGSTCHLVGRQ